MKRIMTLLLALTMLAGLAVSAALAETIHAPGQASRPSGTESGALISWEGFSARLLRYEIEKNREGDTRLYLYTRVVNDTDRTISMDARNITADGVRIMGSGIMKTAPHSDSGEDSLRHFSLWARSENKEEGRNAILNARTLAMQIELRDSDTMETLVRQEVTLDLRSLEGTTEIETPRPTATPKPRPTPEPTPDNRAPAYTPASTDYKTLTEKSRGQAVKDLQQRLWDLNYYANKINGVYEDTTAIAVMSFCTQNGLYIQGDATPEMQELLYSSRAEYYREPWIPVMLGPKFRWRVHGDADVAAIYPMIVNRSPSRTVLGVELYYYYTDVWGERYVGSNGTPLLRRATLQKTMKPGDYYSSEQVLASPYSWINTVYIGINKIVFDDGEIRTAENIQYIGYPMRN